MLFMGKFTFQSTNSDGPPKYMTSVISGGLIAPIVDATVATEKERCILYQPSDGSDGELIIQMGGLDYLSALDTDELGFVNAQQSLENAYRFKLGSSGELGSEVSMQIFLPGQKQWMPIRYTVNTLLPYLVFTPPQGPVGDDPPLLTTFTQKQITPSLATIQSSKSAQKCDLRHVDLSGADLSGIDFTGADFTGATLDGAKFKGAILTNATLVGASLDGTDLSGATLDGAFLNGLNLTKVVWGEGLGLSAKGTHFEGCVATNCQIGSEFQSPPYADFTKAHFDGADFTGADLSNAILQSAYMIGGVFVGVTLGGADLTNAQLGGITLSAAANLAYAYMPNVTLTGANLFGVSFAFSSLFGGSTLIADALTLEQADFSNAYLEGISFKSAHLSGSKFNNACLVTVDFTGADLSPTLTGSVSTSLAGACLQGAIFTGSKLAHADFTGATVAFGRGHINVRYCYPPQGPFPPPPDFEPLNYRKTTGLDLESMQPTTVCPNGSTVQANQERGLSLTQMLTIANPATSWVPIGCFSASPEKERELVDATRVAPPAKDRICETAQAVVRVPDFTALRDICRLGRDPAARRFFFHLEALPASRVAGLIRYHRLQQEKIGLSCWPAYCKDDGAFVGLFELRPTEFGGIGFTVAVMPAFRGNPLVKEICRAVLGYGFSRGGFDRIVALVEPDNLAAREFVPKLGFRRLDDVSAPNELTLNLYEVRRNSLKRSVSSTPDFGSGPQFYDS